MILGGLEACREEGTPSTSSARLWRTIGQSTSYQREKGADVKPIKILVEKHPDGYVAYPLSIRGVVGEGDTYEEVLANVKSAIRFHLETFGSEALEIDPPPLETFVAEVGIEESLVTRAR